MKRIELFEFEDFHWLPDFIRTGVTNLIKVLHKLMGTSDVLADLIGKARQQVDFDQIVDLGSGSGGPMIDVIEKINSEDPGSPVQLLLTDKFPNLRTAQNVNKQEIPHVKYHLNSVDALHLEETPKGLKTMVASFHHMKPANAKQILDSAEQSKEPILIYEIAENKIPVAVWWILLPLSLAILVIMSLIMTLFARPLRPAQLVFTYLLPAIPLVYAWDGQASIMRTYTFEDIKELIGAQTNAHYAWDMQVARKKNGRKAGYFVFGYPVKESAL